MKKFLAMILAVAMMLSMTFALTACGGNKSEVQKAIDAAKKMSLEELEAAAKAEFEAAGAKFTAQSSTSGVGKVLKAFKEKYTWFDFEEFSSCKDSAAYTALASTVAQGNYWADFVLLQEGASFLDYYDEGLICSYAPSESGITLAKSEKDPLVAVYCNKLFTYNKVNNYKGTGEALANVWQLTGKDGTSLKGMKGGVSIQDPTTEAINMSFLTMMTSPDGCDRLSKAYKAYFGKDYQKTGDYKNIGYYFISELLANVKNRHSSDSKIASETLPTESKGFVAIIGLNKMKSYGGTNWQNEVFVSGVDAHLAGFDGFTYMFLAGIPSTSKLPYTACLLTRYMLTQEGYKAGWKDAGYYSANSQVALNADYDMSSADRVQYTLVEDPAYIGKNMADVSEFVSGLWNK